jgi:hypothetical protein
VAHVTLPKGHEERDLLLASRIAHDLGLAELHVFLAPPAPPATSVRRLPEQDSLGLLRFVGLVVEQLGRRLQR